MVPSHVQRPPRIALGLPAITLHRVLAALLALSALALALLNLPYAPRTWFDEGSHLHVPRAIVDHGVYADTSALPDGGLELRYHGPTVGVGPTVMLPIALMFKLFGAGILQGRIVIAAYALIGLAACYALARHMHGQAVALLAAALLLASRTLSYDGYVEYGRQVLGEVPGTVFLVLGALAWTHALSAERGSRRQASRAALAGLGFGLALVTKNQFALIVPPALALVALLDWGYYRAGGWALRLAPPAVAVLCFGVWTLLQYTFSGPGSFWENVHTTQQAAGGAIFAFSLRSTMRAGYYLLRPDLYGGLLLPSLAYAAWRARVRGPAGLAEAMPAVLIGLWLAWFVGASLGWPRYAFPAVALGAASVGRMVADLLAWLWRTRRPAALAVACYAAIAIANPIALTARAVATPDDSAQRFAALMDATVPAGALVATWEQELAVLTDHRYIYPPQHLLADAVRHVWLDGPEVVYDWSADRPPYVVVGPFGGYSDIYDTPELYRDYREVGRVGQYALFARTAP